MPSSPIDSVAVATKTSDASEVIELSVRSMIHDGTLTMADIVWYADDPEQHQCLVTWEVFGGGIMGNLLTDTHEAELSLWPDSKYHIQVTCKNKVNIFVLFFHPLFSGIRYNINSNNNNHKQTTAHCSKIIIVIDINIVVVTKQQQKTAPEKPSNKQMHTQVILAHFICSFSNVLRTNCNHHVFMSRLYDFAHLFT